MSDTVTISVKRYDELLDAEFRLHCLENGGVWAWEWYEASLRDGGYFNDEDES